MLQTLELRGSASTNTFTSSVSTSTSIPEPASSALLVIGCAGCAMFQFSRKRLKHKPRE